MGVQKERENFLKCVKEKQHSQFVSYVTGKIEDFKLDEALQAVKPSELFPSLHNNIVEPIITAWRQHQAIEIEQQKPFDENQLEALLCAIKVITVFIEEKSRKVPDILHNTVQDLHDAIFDFENAAMEEILDSTRNNNRKKSKSRPAEKITSTIAAKIVDICEMWWLQERPGKDNLVPQTISYMLIKALDDQGKNIDVQRLYNFRNALLLIDFNDESSNYLKTLLKNCLIHPLFLRNQKKGLPFLIYLFGLHPPFIDDLHNTIKAQIPSTKKSLLDAYGQIYYKAWKGANGPYLMKIEYTCIQDLMNTAIHVAKTSVSRAIMRVLSVIHSKKKERGVDAMLLTLYEPFLWRSLKVANPLVRRNACAIFMEVFPLRNPDDNQRAIDQLLQKQISLLEALLYDPAVCVRSVAVSGVCRILGIYWEVIPEHTIRVLLSHIVNELASDSSSSAVRIAVLEGLKYLLDNHLSQPMLKAVLPKMSTAIHDTTEKVRLAFVDLLLAIKGIKAIKWYEVVEVEHVLARLAMDGPSIGKKITELIANSYFPQNQTSSVQVKRCLVLLKTNKEAGFAFYGYLSRVSSVAALAKFVGSLYRYINKCLRAEGSSTLDETSDNNNDVGDDSVVEGTGTGKVDEEMLITLLEVISKIWDSIAGELDKKDNEQLKQYLMDTFQDDVLGEFVAHLGQDERAQKAILRMASHLPRTSIPRFSNLLMKQLSKFEGADDSEYQELLNCLFSWDYGDEVISFVKECIQGGDANEDEEDDSVDKENRKNVDNGSNKSSKRPKKHSKSSKRSKSLDESELASKSLFGLKLLNHLMAKETTRTVIFSQEYTKQLVEIMQSLLKYFVKIQERLHSTENDDTQDEAIIVALSTYAKLFIHLCATLDELEKDAEALKELITWTEEVILPALELSSDSDVGTSDASTKKRKKGSNTSTSESKKTSLSREEFVYVIAEILAVMLSECITFRLCSSQLKTRATHILNTMLQAAHSTFKQGPQHPGHKFLKEVLPVVSKVVFQFFLQDDYTAAKTLLDGLFASTPEELFMQDEVPKLVRLGELLGLHQQQSTLPTFIEDILTPIMEQIDVPSSRLHANLSNNAEELENPSLAFVLTTITRSTAWVNALSNHLTQTITKSGNSMESIWKALEIISVVVNSHQSLKKKTDLTSVQNCLISIISKLPSNTEDEEGKFCLGGHMKSLANGVLKNALQEITN